jgi:hypothetical protein
VYKSEKKLTSMTDCQESGPVTGVEVVGLMGPSTPPLRIMPVRWDQLEIADATARWEVVGSVLGSMGDGALRGSWVGPTYHRGLVPDRRNIAIAAG